MQNTGGWCRPHIRKHAAHMIGEDQCIHHPLKYPETNVQSNIQLHVPCLLSAIQVDTKL